MFTFEELMEILDTVKDEIKLDDHFGSFNCGVDTALLHVFVKVSQADTAKRIKQLTEKAVG